MDMTPERRADLEYSLARSRRLVSLLELALDAGESDEARRIAVESAEQEIMILAARPLAGPEEIPVTTA